MKLGAPSLPAGSCTVAECAWAAAAAAGPEAAVLVCVDNLGFDCAAPGWNNECREDNNAHTLSVPGCL